MEHIFIQCITANKILDSLKVTQAEKSMHWNYLSVTDIFKSYNSY